MLLMTQYGEKFAVALRLRVGLAVSFVMLLLVPAINLLTALPASYRIALSLAATLASGLSAGVLTSTAFAASAVLPGSYTTALMTGQGVAGIVVGGLELFLEFVAFPTPSMAFSCRQHLFHAIS